MYRYLIPLALLSILVACATQPSSSEPRDWEDTVGNIPLEILTRPIPLRNDLVTVHQPTSTASDVAQAYYDQGVTALQLYGWIEAARSFHAALAHDPELALAWLGLSEAYTRLSDRDAALAALERAEALATTQNLSSREHAWLELGFRIRRESRAVRLWGEDEQDALRSDAQAAAEQFPDAPEFLFLLGNIMPREEQASWLKLTLEIDPNHAGAHHELVHRYEIDPENISLAVKHGERLREIAPGFAHAIHMLGHNLGRVGRMEEAKVVFEETDQIELRLQREEGVLVKHDWHHAHNLSFLVLVNYYLGDFYAAETALIRYREEASRNDSSDRQRMLIMFEFGYHLGRGDWDALSTLAMRARLIDDTESLAVAEYIDATRLIANNRTKAARETMNRADAILGRRDLSRMTRTARDIPAAILSSLDGDDEPIESLAERLANDSNPHLWIRAHWHLDGMARLMTAVDLLEQKEWLTEVLIQHDPNYRGGPLLLANMHHPDDVD